MVKSVSTLARNGVQDFLLQRISAAYMAIFLLGFVLYFIGHPLDFENWHAVFSANFMRIATLFFLLSLAAHAWIGMWTIATDYLKGNLIRLIFLIIIMFILFASLIWGIVILWG